MYRRILCKEVNALNKVFEAIASWWEWMVSIAMNFQFKDAVDIIIVAFLIYGVVKLVRETRAGQLVKGLFLLVILFIISSYFNLVMVSRVLAYFFQFSAIMQIGKIYVGYDILYFSVFAAVVGAIPREKMARGRADGRRAVVRAVLLHELQPHDLPDDHLHDQLRRCARGPCVRRGGGRVAGAAPKFSPKWAVLPILALSANIKGQYVCIGAGGGGAGGCGRVAVCRRRRFQGRSAPPHRVQPCLLCRADGNLLSVECALCRLARQPQRQ